MEVAVSVMGVKRSDAEDLICGDAIKALRSRELLHVCKGQPSYLGTGGQA